MNKTIDAYQVVNMLHSLRLVSGEGSGSLLRMFLAARAKGSKKRDGVTSLPRQHPVPWTFLLSPRSRGQKHSNRKAFYAGQRQVLRAGQFSEKEKKILSVINQKPCHSTAENSPQFLIYHLNCMQTFSQHSFAASREWNKLSSTLLLLFVWVKIVRVRFGIWAFHHYSGTHRNIYQFGYSSFFHLPYFIFLFLLVTVFKTPYMILHELCLSYKQGVLKKVMLPVTE